MHKILVNKNLSAGIFITSCIAAMGAIGVYRLFISGFFADKHQCLTITQPEDHQEDNSDPLELLGPLDKYFQKITTALDIKIKEHEELVLKLLETTIQEFNKTGTPISRIQNNQLQLCLRYLYCWNLLTVILCLHQKLKHPNLLLPYYANCLDPANFHSNVKRIFFKNIANICSLDTNRLNYKNNQYLNSKLIELQELFEVDKIIASIQSSFFKETNDPGLRRNIEQLLLKYKQNREILKNPRFKQTP